MAETVGQHSVAAFTSPVNGTTPIDANTVRGNDNTVRSAYVDHDADPGIHVQSSTLASRPVAGTAGRKWVTVSSGRYQFWYDDGSRWNEVASDAINVDCLADTALTKGDVVKITGFNNGQNLPTVAKVSASTDTAFGLVENTVSSGAIVQIINTGLIEDVDTNGYAVGTVLYPNTSGGWTTTKPTSGNYQPAGYVLRGNTNTGVLYVEFSAPRIVERSDNTASTIVLRDASGNFAAGTITAGALTSTGLVTFASLKGTGATTVTNILDEDNMASDSATALATQQSIKAYVDAKVATVDTLAEVLANGNTTGANNIIVSTGQKIQTPTIAAFDNTTAISIANSTGALTLATALADSNLATISTAGKVANSATTATALNTSSAIVARDSSGNFAAGTITANLTGNISGTAPAGTLTGTTLASNVVSSSLTSVGTLTSLAVSGDITASGGTANGVGYLNASKVFTTGSAFQFDGTSVILGTNTSNYGLLNLSRYTSAPYASLTITDQATPANEVGIYLRANGSNPVGISSAGAPIAFYTAGPGTTERMRLDASGNLGVGTTSADDKIHAYGSGTQFIRVGTASTGSYRGFAIGNTDSDTAAYGLLQMELSQGQMQLVAGASGFGGFLTIHTNGSERARIDTSGNLGLGVTPSAWNSTTRAIQVGNTGAGIWAYTQAGTSQEYVHLVNNSFLNASGQDIYISDGPAAQYQQVGASHYWYNAASGTAGNAITFTQAMTLDASGNLLLGTTSGGEAINVKRGASTSAYAEFAGNNNGIGTASVLYGQDSGSNGYFWNRANAPILFGTNNTERARITSGGYFKASNDATYVDATGAYHEIRTNQSDNTLYVTNKAASNPYGILMTFTAASPNDSTRYFFSAVDSTTVRARIYSNGGLANYQSNNSDLSDARTKTDITPLDSMWDKVAALEIVSYKYVDQTHDDVNLGVIAQQVETVEPVWVDSDGFGDTPEGEEPFKSVYNKDITFAAIKALQEAMARIEALEARLEALEA